jgi:two-component system, cell cycle sensor histidine kinase and response regulator CckA
MDQPHKPILIVEDETPVRSLLKVMLTEEGFEVVEAKDGTVALHELWKRKGNVAMLVTDIDMGRMGGIELAQSVRAQYPDLPILFVSGLPMPQEEVERIVSGGILVTKPFDVATLVAAVRKLA